MPYVVTRKGQVTIPKPIREFLNIHAKDRVEFVREGERFTCRSVVFDREGIFAFGKEYDSLPVRHVKEALSRVAGK